MDSNPKRYKKQDEYLFVCHMYNTLTILLVSVSIQSFTVQ